MDDPRVQEFVRLFDAGEFFEAHEVLEDLWQEYGGEDRTFYQGLIQVAVALEHRLRGNPRGARGVLDSARRNLSPYLPAHRGFKLESILRDASRHVDDPESSPPPRLGPPPDGA